MIQDSYNELASVRRNRAREERSTGCDSVFNINCSQPQTEPIDLIQNGNSRGQWTCPQVGGCAAHNPRQMDRANATRIRRKVGCDAILYSAASLSRQETERYFTDHKNDPEPSTACSAGTSGPVSLNIIVEGRRSFLCTCGDPGKFAGRG